MALTTRERDGIDAYWRAANYLSVGQIYLLDDPLLERPLTPEDVKPRLLGHWGTTPGLNFVCAHLNRVIRREDLDMILVTGPGHGGPALVANAYLEGSWGDVHPGMGDDREGLRRLMRQFSFPGGIPSHAAPPVPGSINEGGELGYSLAHAFGAAFDNPGLIACCVVGDGEAETGPLAASWQSTRFLDPVGDGAVLPVLHLNGFKIANPTVLARIGEDDLEGLLRGSGWAPRFVCGAEPAVMHAAMADALDGCLADIRGIQDYARSEGTTPDGPPRWPMIVLRTPKGWTGPREVDGMAVEGTFRAHQVPLGNVRSDPAHLVQLEEWMRSYRPEELFDDDGALRPRLRALAPDGDRRLGSNPHSNGGRVTSALELSDVRRYAVEVKRPGTGTTGATSALGPFLRDVIAASASPSTRLATRARRRATTRRSGRSTPPCARSSWPRARTWRSPARSAGCSGADREEPAPRRPGAGGRERTL